MREKCIEHRAWCSKTEFIFSSNFFLFCFLFREMPSLSKPQSSDFFLLLQHQNFKSCLCDLLKISTISILSLVQPKACLSLSLLSHFLSLLNFSKNILTYWVGQKVVLVFFHKIKNIFFIFTHNY